jgi:hypothetical protein
MLKSIMLVGALFAGVAHAATAAPKVVFIGDQFTYTWGTTPGAFPSNWINQGWARPSGGLANCYVNQQGLAYALSSGTANITYTSPTGVRFSEWTMYITEP